MASENTQFTPTLRGAIVGFGAVAAEAHLPVWLQNPQFKISAVVEPSPERIRRAKKVLSEAAVYPDME